MTPGFENYCGHPSGLSDDVLIEVDSFESPFDDVWTAITVTGSPRSESWHALAEAIDGIDDGCPCVVVIDSAGGDLIGLGALQRAIHDTTDRMLFGYVPRRAFGASFVAAAMFPILWASPSARLGGLDGDELAISEAAESVRRLLAVSDEELGRALDRSRLRTRLAAGHEFNGEEGDLLSVCSLAVCVENCCVPVASTFQESEDD